MKHGDGGRHMGPLDHIYIYIYLYVASFTKQVSRSSLNEAIESGSDKHPGERFSSKHPRTVAVFTFIVFPLLHHVSAADGTPTTYVWAEFCEQRCSLVWLMPQSSHATISVAQ